MPDENALAEAQSAIESPVTEGNPAAPAVTEPAAPSEPKDEHRSRAKERIQELAADKRAAIEFAELQRKRADELEALLKASTPQAESKGQPKLADFQTPEEWAAATQVWAVAEASKAVDKRLTDRDSEAAEKQRHQAFQASLQSAAKGKPDFWDVVSDESVTWLHKGVVDVLQDFDNGGELAYHLARNPSEGREIAALPPRRMAAALGRLETKLSQQKPVPPKPKVTEAPEPPTPVGGGSAVTADFSKLSTADYIKARREQRKKR